MKKILFLIYPIEIDFNSVINLRRSFRTISIINLFSLRAPRKISLLFSDPVHNKLIKLYAFFQMIINRTHANFREDLTIMLVKFITTSTLEEKEKLSNVLSDNRLGRPTATKLSRSIGKYRSFGLGIVRHVVHDN